MEGGGLATVTSAFEAPSPRPLGSSTSGLVLPVGNGNGNGPSDTTTTQSAAHPHSIQTLLEQQPTPSSLPQTQTHPPVQTTTEPPRHHQVQEPMLPYHPHPHHLDTPSFQFPPLRQSSGLPLPTLSMPHSNPFLSLPHLVQMSLAGGSKQPGESGFQHDAHSLLSLVGSGNGSHLGSDASSATTSNPNASSSALRTSIPSGVDRPVFINLKEREEVAKAAYRAWFRLKPGHKELKDRWWAIYYRKISPRFHLRDNYLGRKINEWIEEDMATRKQTDPEFAQLVANYRKATKPGRKPKPLVPREDGTPSKKRKPNSSKEGNLPAYLNVELVHPPKDDPNNADVKLLMAASDDGDIDWSSEDLETDIEWFKQNRQAIMDGIPSLSNRLKGVNFTSALLSLTNATPAQRKAKIDDLGEVVVDVTEGDWVKIDIHRVHDSLIFKADLPGLSPSDLVGLIQSDGNNKIAIKGMRKRDYNDDLPEGNQPILSERSFGKFEVHLTLPSVADARKTEQVYCNGVLTLKVPIRQQEWKALDIQYLS